MRIVHWAALAAILLIVPAAAADGIDVMRGDRANSCTASDPKGFSLSNGGLSVAIEQKRYLLIFMMSIMADPIPSGDYPATLTLDAQPPITIEVHGEGGVYVAMLSEPQWLALRNVQKVALNVRGASYVFDAGRLAEVMDAAANCAGVPTIERIQEARAKIVKAVGGSWIIRPDEKARGVCRGTRLGLEVDSFVTQRGADRFEFGVARMSWQLEPGKTVPATIEIDQDPPRPVQVVTSRQTANVIADDDLQKRLETAQVVIWHLPWGTFRSEVNGVPELREKLAECVKKASN